MGPENSNPMDRTLTILRIIVIALISGVVIFMGVVAAIKRGQPPAGGPFLAYILAATAIPILFVRLIIPSLMVKNGCRQLAGSVWAPPDLAGQATAGLSAGTPEWETAEQDKIKLAELFQRKTIMGAAMCEGAALMNVAAFMLERQLFSLLVVGAFVLGIAFDFPTRDRLQNWMDHQILRVRDMRNSMAK